MFRYCKGLLASWNATRIACRQHSEYLVRGVTAGAAEWHSPRPQSHTVTDDILDNPHTLHGHRHRHNHSHNRSHIHRHMHTLYRQMDYRAAEMSMLVPLLSQFQTPQTQSKTELCQKRHAHNLSLTTFRDDGRPLTKRLTLRTCQHLSQFCHKRGNSHSRPFSSSSGHDDDSSHNYKTTGLILQIPSPIKWLRNYFYMYLLKNKLGSKFNLHEFQLGARQVTSIGIWQDHYYKELRARLFLLIISKLYTNLLTVISYVSIMAILMALFNLAISIVKD